MEVGAMPKENINDCITPGMRVEVGWGAIAGADDSGYVQVGATNERVPLVPQVVCDDKGNSIEHDGEPITGWFVHLDRAGINRLIKALRKARDSAYGADA
jgi:hypothetical protein